MKYGKYDRNNRVICEAQQIAHEAIAISMPEAIKSFLLRHKLL